jgi:hypothetical protein
MQFLKFFTWGLWALVFLCCEPGCSGKSVESYKPTSESARKAIETALSTWKSGAAHGSITNVKPSLDVFDARWQAGTKLENYEILEEVTGKPQPHFKVKLKLAGKPEETTEYLVVGIDPLNIFRQDDYNKATGM